MVRLLRERVEPEEPEEYDDHVGAEARNRAWSVEAVVVVLGTRARVSEGSSESSLSSRRLHGGARAATHTCGPALGSAYQSQRF